MSIETRLTSTYRNPINGLRGIAALMVAIYHFPYYSDYLWLEEFPFMRIGFSGVDFFFILSGVIISHVYLEKFVKFDPKEYFVFLYLRFSRLFPGHFFVMICFLFVTILGTFWFGSISISWSEFKDWLLQAFLIRPWTFPMHFVWNSPAWSIGAELFAYVFLFPFFAKMANRKSRAVASIYLIGTGLLCLFVLVHLFQTLNMVRYGGPLIRVTFEFMVGVGLYCVLDVCRHKKLPWDTVFVLGVAMFIAIAASRQTLRESNLAVLSDWLVLVAFCLIISATYASDTGASKVLGSKFFFWLGEISFAIYVCHIPLYILSDFVTISVFDVSYRGILYNFMILALVIVVAHLIHVLVESPSRQFLRCCLGR